MPTFTYQSKKSVVDGNDVYVYTLQVGGANVGSANLIKRSDETFWRMDNYKVHPSGQGYPYALTFCMLRTIEVKGGTRAIIPSAHDGMIGVGAAGFTEMAGSRMMKKGVLEQVSFETNNITTTKLAQQTKMNSAKYNLQEQVSNGGGSCCYITTAVCNALGLGDDCDELMALRGFRDEVLLQTEQGKQDVAQYYAIAPAIVAAIDQCPDARAIYDDLYRRYIAPAVAALAAGQPAQSDRLFRALVAETAATHLPAARAAQ
jgi:hypothetical protein